MRSGRVVGVIAAVAGVALASGGVSAAAIPEPSPILIEENATWRFDADCAYFTALWSGLSRSSWMWVPPGRPVRFLFEVGTQNDGLTCEEIVSEQSAGGSTMYGQTARVDLNGDGDFESMRVGPGIQLITPPLAKRDEPYLITAIWIAPNGNRIINQMALYVGTTSSVTINGGAEYTNDANVTIVLTPEPGARYVHVSNDGGFSGGEIFDVGREIPWRLSSGVSGLLTKVVYVRFLEANGRVMSTLTDDIVLDTVPPVVTSATVAPATVDGGVSRSKRVTVAIDARDNRSGVARVQVSSTRSARGATSAKFRARVQVARPDGGAKFVRVRDGAGNWSTWRAVG